MDHAFSYPMAFAHGVFDLETSDSPSHSLLLLPKDNWNVCFRFSLFKHYVWDTFHKLKTWSSLGWLVSLLACLFVLLSRKLSTLLKWSTLDICVLHLNSCSKLFKHPLCSSVNFRSYCQLESMSETLQCFKDKVIKYHRFSALST